MTATRSRRSAGLAEVEKAHLLDDAEHLAHDLDGHKCLRGQRWSEAAWRTFGGNGSLPIGGPLAPACVVDSKRSG